MNLLLDSIRRVLPKANRKAHDFDDVKQIARRERITLITGAAYRSDILGYYTTRKTANRIKKFIMINALLTSEAEKTFVGLHELAHHFLHAPIHWRQPLHCIRNNKKTQSKYDSEADAFALIAMIPLWLLIEMRETHYASIRPELEPFLTKRQKIWELHGI